MNLSSDGVSASVTGSGRTLRCLLRHLLLICALLVVGVRSAAAASPILAVDDDPPTISIELTPNRSSTTADFLVYDGEPLSFDGSGSYDPDGGALTKHDWTINYTSGKPKDYAGVVFDTSYALANGSLQTMRLLIRDNENNYVSKTVTIEVVAAPAVVWKRTYFIRDHLGSVRVAFNEEGEVVEATDYYPFGLEMPTRSFVAGTGVKENYTGHELDSEVGLLYAGARYLDPAVARWLSVDPLAEDYPSLSPYNYAANNPLINYDPDGRSIWTKLVKAGVKIGKVVARDGVRSLGRGATYADAFAGVLSDVETLTDDKASGGSRVFALVSLASEISPISIGDIKDGAKLLKRAVDNADDAADAARTGERAAASGTSGSRVNKVRPTEGAGPHTGFKRDPQTGNITGYTEYDAAGNPVKRFRGEGRTHSGVAPPLVLERKPGKGRGSKPNQARPARPDEIPGGGP